MRRIVVLLSGLFILLAADAVARGSVGKSAKRGKARVEPTPHVQAGRAHLPPDLRSRVRGPEFTPAAVDTFELGWFDFGGAYPDAQGWTSVDLTTQRHDLFHVADGVELNGGKFGTLLPLEGAQSMWCGVTAGTSPDFCRYATLPGYGNSWYQFFTSKTLSGCDSVSLSYKIAWDSEPGYDRTAVEWRAGGADWDRFDGVNHGFGSYEDEGVLVDNVGLQTNGTDIELRFLFTSDGAWSDEDGIFPTDGAVRVDSITISCLVEQPPSSGNWVVSATYFENFEDESPGDLTTTDGCWTGGRRAGFGDFGQLYHGTTVLQDDPCFFNTGFFWGFFDDPAISPFLCHNPPAPTQGVTRKGPDSEGLYLNNAIESPLIPNVGSGDQYLLEFLVYRDLPFDNLFFYRWEVSSLVAGCHTDWATDNFVYYSVGEASGNPDWFRASFDIGPYIIAGASHVRVRLVAVDMCPVWCGAFGSGICATPSPLFDDVRIRRTATVGPQFSVRHLDLFQDNFASDGTVTGSARADAARDIADRSSSPTIQPGDSVTMIATGVGVDANTGMGPAAYLYVAVWPPNQPAKTPSLIEAPETRLAIGKRWPLVDTIDHGGVTWACYRMDSTYTAAGAALKDRWCVDLNDNVFTPGDTVCYVLGADDGFGNARYFSRRLNGQGANFATDDLWEALASPMEFTILPAGGWARGGDILYVDVPDDRAGPPQLFFDTTFELVGDLERIDRYDVLDPTAQQDNTLASRVKNPVAQIFDCYRIIIWNSGNLSRGAIGPSGGFPQKENDDLGLLFDFLDTKTDEPGLYITGDNIASTTFLGSLRPTFINFSWGTSSQRDHVMMGEPLSPELTAAGPCYIELGVPNTFVAYAGCQTSQFDVLPAAGQSVTQFPYPNGSGDAVISQATPNSAGSIARVVLSGFSFDAIRDVEPGFPPARVTHYRNTMACLQKSTGSPIGIETLAADFLTHAAPNPFNPETTIRYGVRERGHVTLRVYNVAGQLVRTLVDEIKAPVESGFEVTWDGRDNRGTQVSTGVYFYKLSTTGFVQTKKMVLLK